MRRATGPIFAPLARCLLGLAVCGGFALFGCAREEKVLDVEAPGVDVDVRRKTDGGVDVDVRRTPDGGVDVDVRHTPGGGVDVDVRR